MIYDAIDNHRLYAPLSARIAGALAYLASLSAGAFREQTVEVEGRDLYALFQAYSTEGEAGRFYESHRACIDIQYVVSGVEVIRVAKTDSLRVHSAYDEGRDITLYEPDPGTNVILRSGDFVILYPHDAHLPKLPLSEPGEVRKVVVKVRV